MASKAHQFLAMSIVIMMRNKGYEVVAFDGDYSKISEIPCNIPPTIKRHRPDVLGISTLDEHLCIGEAKTGKDLRSKRTEEQFQDYADIILEDSKPACEFIIAIPKSAELVLINMLSKLGICNNQNVSYLSIPEVLFPK